MAMAPPRQRQPRQASGADVQAVEPEMEKKGVLEARPPTTSLGTSLRRLASGSSFSTLLILGALLRLLLILYGVHHDKQHALKYTDVDYYVFNDAAAFILRSSPQAEGPVTRYFNWSIGSPYDRATYRYTPILALLLLPNHLIHHTYGKLLFCTADIVVSILLYRILVKQYLVSEAKAKLYIGTCWLFNPFIANISSRGSSESLLGVIVVGALALANEGRWMASSSLFGLAVHFKIYPVIYASAVLARLQAKDRVLPNGKQLAFGAVSFAVFMLANAAMYAIWGIPFLEHTYLYHLTRLDHRHNFSTHFYPIYLDMFSSNSRSTPSLLQTLKLGSLLAALKKIAKSSFAPQLGLSLFIGLRLGGTTSLAFTWFLQTLAFTSFNRVCTSQYFMWFLWFLPLVLAKVHLGNRHGAKLLGLWILGQVLWLSTAYRLEFEGKPVFLELWGASIIFFLVNVFILWQLLGMPHAL